MESESDTLAPLQANLRDLLAWLHAAHVEGVIIGGVAAAILGRPRVTRDVDAVVLLDEPRWAEFLTLGQTFGFLPRLSDALDFARQSRVLLVRHQPSGIDADISLGPLPFEEEVLEWKSSIQAGGLTLPLPTQAVAHRPRDLTDIEGVLDANPKLDLRRIRRWVGEFADVLEAPELVEDLEKLLAKRKKPRRRKGRS